MNKLILVLVLTVTMLTSCTQKKAQAEPMDNTSNDSVAFAAFAEHFSESSSFAFVDISDRKVMLVSQETFGDNDTANLQAVEATLFAADSHGKIICLGSVRSQGSLYPVSMIDGKVIVGGHQFIRIYGIRGDVPELVLDRFAEGEGEELTAMNQLFFEQSTPIKFFKQ